MSDDEKHNDEMPVADEWATVKKKKKKPRPKMHFSEEEANRLQDEENVFGLAEMLRRPMLNRAIDDGFRYAGILRGGEAVPDEFVGMEHQRFEIPHNRWGDVVLVVRS